MAKLNDSNIVSAYFTHLLLEKSLSGNTIEAYTQDLEKLLSYLQDEGKKPQEVALEDLQQFIAQLCDLGIHARSQARIISGIKSFFRFLVLEKWIDNDPTEILESPKIGMKLPEVLTIDEINRIISELDLSQPEGQRKYCKGIYGKSRDS